MSESNPKEVIQDVARIASLVGTELNEIDSMWDSASRHKHSTMRIDPRRIVKEIVNSQPIPQRGIPPRGAPPIYPGPMQQSHSPSMAEAMAYAAGGYPPTTEQTLEPLDASRLIAPAQGIEPLPIPVIPGTERMIGKGAPVPYLGYPPIPPRSEDIQREFNQMTALQPRVPDPQLELPFMKSIDPKLNNFRTVQDLAIFLIEKFDKIEKEIIIMKRMVSEIRTNTEKKNKKIRNRYEIERTTRSSESSSEKG